MIARPLLLVALFLLPGLAYAAEPAPVGAAAQPPVVVELFTSQGCSSCPPADDYLGRLARRPDILALAFHVEYWNYIGWTDTFAKPWATRRQHDYMQSLHLRYIYTPEMVVNGAAEGVGSEPNAIEPLILAASKPRPHPSLTLQWRGDGALLIDVGAGVAPPKGQPVLWLVGFDGTHQTEVDEGENSGKMLTDYQAVRSFRRIGSWKGVSEQVVIPPADAAGLGDAGVAVLLQAGGTGPILTAARLAAAR